VRGLKVVTTTARVRAPWSSRATGVLLVVCCGAVGEVRAAVVRVPQDFPGIQAAIGAAQTGDTVLVSPGTYGGDLTISGKTITLASNFIHTGDPNDITQTTIDGGSPILTIDASVGAATTVRGLTFRNGDYQIINFARRVNILDNRFIDGGGDQVSFEGAGGLVRDCFFDNAGDDGIDADDDSDPTIRDNTILNAGNDGIEMRLHNFTGPALEIFIRGNVISGCTEDGIQLIDYAGASSRVIKVEGNVLSNNGKAGLGCMADGNTTENFAGAPLVEQVRVIGNTFSGNPHGLTGGDNMLVLNNIFVGASQIGVKRVAASSQVAYNDFWSNGTDYTGSNVDVGTCLLQDPLLDPNHDLQAGSPCIDAGAASIVWNGATVRAPPYSGAAPDLGADESSFGPPLSADPTVPAAGLRLAGVRPNPSRHELSVTFTLPDAAPARIELIDLAGRRISLREVGGLGPGSHVVSFPEVRTLATGVYLVRLSHGGRSLTTRAVVIR
jgi:parallel beta helix pectate lyase-like protein